MFKKFVISRQSIKTPSNSSTADRTTCLAVEVVTSNDF